MTSTQFASVMATGTDWRDVCQKLLEKINIKNQNYNVGFLYITDGLAEDAASILTLFKSVTGIPHWVGCVGLGVVGCGTEYIDKPAISAMVGRFDEKVFQTIKIHHTEQTEIKNETKTWMETRTPMLTLIHGDPTTHNHPEGTIKKISDALGGFIVGGLTSSRTTHMHFAGDMMDDGFSGMMFNDSVAVSCAVSQGCVPIGTPHIITRADDHIILEIDGQKPSDIFAQTVRDMVMERTGHDPESIAAENDIPPEFKNLFRGDMHVAFPTAGHDTGDFMVRNIVGIDPEDGYMAVTHRCKNGDPIIFVHRDDDTVKAELRESLKKLRARVEKERGEFTPKGAVYISCVARTSVEFETGIMGGEMALVRDIIGDVPLTGFYAGGEISSGRLYGYSSVMILFL